VWGEGSGARRGPVFLCSDLRQVVRGAAGKFAPVETASSMFPEIRWLHGTKVGQVGGRRMAVRSELYGSCPTNVASVIFGTA